MHPAAPSGREDLLSAIDAAKILGLSADMVRLLAREGRLLTAAHTVRGQRLFRRSDVEDLAAERTGHPSHRHIVQFYDEDSSIGVIIADFASGALRTGAPVALILTAPHRADIGARIAAQGIDVRAVSASGQLQLHDAAGCLASFMKGGMPDAERFRVAMAALLAEVARPRARVRLYSDMVDVLCEAGNHAAAVRLEELWNYLAGDHSFSLVCGYRMGHFGPTGSAEQFESICDSHTHVVPAESYALDAPVEDCMRDIAVLQQRAISLGGETSRRRELEDRLRESVAERERVEDRLRRAEGQLREQTGMLVDATQAKDEFLAMLGHELRNPLAPIQTALELMRLRGPASREQGLLERQVGYLVRLVDDLLDVSRLTRGTIELHRRPVELTEVVQAAVNASCPLLQQRCHQLHIAVPAGLVLDIDPDRMAQVVANLLTNAAKYSSPGSTIVVSAERSAGSVRLSVKDEGIGIDPDMVRRVFDSFVQQTQTIDRSSGGLGLGLAIVRNLVHLHGGTVEVQSEGPGQGSEFTVVLPEIAARDADSGSGRNTAEPHDGRPSGPRRILVVDDNEDLAALIGELLEIHGHQVELAHDGPTAIETAARFQPDVALLDIGLPAMDGYEVAAQLRATADPIVLVAVSGYGQAADRQRSEEAGFTAHLVKPVNPDLLAQLVGTLPRPAPKPSPG
ncbi:MAG TPA: ATP-binding protein [Kofleriaceae bacterium]|nr:ATP-binding protein [Kofleriaceae bacterium]